MIRVKIKPLSVNDAWKGQRFRSNDYKQYEHDVLLMLPNNIKIELKPNENYQITFKFGFSSASSDWDNPIKPLQDIIAKKYGFNDKRIKRGVVDVEKVKKGNEYFEFNIEKIL
jgi:Holliday junction resolvase RusA-like endonuclease